MFPVSGRIPTPPVYVPSDPDPPPDLSGYVTTQQLSNALAALPTASSGTTTTLPVVRKACASNLMGTASDGLIQTTADYDKLYLIHGTSMSFSGDSQFTQVLLGGNGLGGLGGSGGVFYVYVNGAATWPLRFRAPLDDVIEYDNGTFTEDWNDENTWAQGTYVRVQRRPAGYYGSKTSWKLSPINYTHAPTAILDPVALRTIIV